MVNKLKCAFEQFFNLNCRFIFTIVNIMMFRFGWVNYSDPVKIWWITSWRRSWLVFWWCLDQWLCDCFHVGSAGAAAGLFVMERPSCWVGCRKKFLTFMAALNLFGHHFGFDHRCMIALRSKAFLGCWCWLSFGLGTIAIILAQLEHLIVESAERDGLSLDLTHSSDEYLLYEDCHQTSPWVLSDSAKFQNSI